MLTGPRQVGKTTAARQIADAWVGPTRYAAADEAFPVTLDWLRAEWQLARRDAAAAPCLLVLDEVQKVPGWSEVVKALWDEDRRHGHRVRVLLLGSSALLLAHGTTESLAGRFLLYQLPHWTWRECRDAFGWDLDRWLTLGGYPGAARVADDLFAWRAYVRDAIIEPAIARDVLAQEKVAKPALLRNLFLLACRFPAQELSYTKMLGQLQDAGNTTTLAHYLRLLERAWLVSGLERFSSGGARSRGSSPKLLLGTNAFATAVDTRSQVALREDHSFWGRLVENAVGAHLVSHLPATAYGVTYWRRANDEVDFVVRSGDRLWAIEVKSGRPRATAGLTVFRRLHPTARPVVVGAGGVSLAEFFLSSPDELLTTLS